MLTDRVNQAGKPVDVGAVKAVSPPAAVLIDLRAVYTSQPHFKRPNVTVIASLDLVVAGLLDAWVLTSQGWFGACRYKVELGYGTWAEQSHLVPGWCLRHVPGVAIAD